MFRDEARLAIRLNHPNVVQTLEVIEEGGELSIAMEYLHGQSLTAVLNHYLTAPHELSLALRLRIMLDVLAGLHHAHELTDYAGRPLDVVHRDVNPHNIFITYDGQVKLMDFGVAKSVAAAYQTRPGAIKGKLAYVAPEYLRSDVVDRRTDVFAAGVVLWELLAGRRLWHGMAEAQIVHHLAAASAVPALPPDAIRPPVLDAICARALAMDPDERYASAADMEIDLQRVLAGAADSHARTLGRVVSFAFMRARAEREALIRALETTTDRGSHAAAPAPDPIWTPPTESTKESSWAREIDACLSVTDDMLDITVVDTSGPPEPAPAPTRLPEPPGRPRNRWAGAIAGLALATVALGLTVAEARRGGTVPPPLAPPAAAPAPHLEAAPRIELEPLPPDHPVYTGSMPDGVKVTEVDFRRYGEMKLQHRVRTPALKALSVNGKLKAIYSDFDETWIYTNAANLMAVALRRDVASPFLVADASETNPKKDDQGDKKKK